MRRFCSVHTRSTMCDGKNTLAEMAAAAFAAGAEIIMNVKGRGSQWS